MGPGLAASSWRNKAILGKHDCKHPLLCTALNSLGTDSIRHAVAMICWHVFVIDINQILVAAWIRLIADI